MNKQLPFKFLDDIDITFDFGDYEINIIHVAFLPPRINWFVPKHKHSGFEIHYVPTGYGVLNTRETSYEIKPSTLYLIGPKFEHEQLSDSKNPMSEFGINFEIKKKKHLSIKNNSTLNAELNTLVEYILNTDFFFTENYTELNALFETLYNELANKIIGYYQNSQNIISQIIIKLARTISLNPKANYAIPSKHSDFKRQSAISDYISFHYKDGTLHELAQILNISIRQLNRDIAKMYDGRSFTKVLNCERIDYAKSYLLQSDMTIEKIAEAIGFNSASYFSNVFKQIEGVSPKFFRSRNAKNSISEETKN